MSLLASIKNAALERFLQHVLGGAGIVGNLVLDTRAKTLAFDLALKGEAESLPIVTAYSIHRNERGTWLSIREVTTSKEWADILVKRFLRDPIKLPGAIRLVL